MIGWLGLTIYVVAYDIWAAKTKRQTLSTAFYEAVSSPRHRYGVVLVWAYLTGHLFKILPRRFDPPYQLARKVFDGQENH